MKLSKNTQLSSSQEKLNTLTPAHQDFNFEVWAMAVREQMISVLAHKGSINEKPSRSTLNKMNQGIKEDNLLNILE